MPSQDEIFNQKKSFIEKATNSLDKTFTSLSEALLKTIIEKFADQLDRDGDTIKNTSKNIQLIAAIEKFYNEFALNNIPILASQIINNTNRISQYNVDYFSEFDSDKRKYKATTEKIQKIIQDRLGVTRGTEGAKVQLKPGGYMDSLLQDNTVKNQIKDLAYREVLKEVGFQDFKRGLENFIVGDEERLGGFRQFYRNFAYDIFVQVDRTEATMFANNLALEFFIYEGSLIETSRAFCKKRAGKVFSTEEAQQWVNDAWIKDALDKGKIASYDPVQDMGLWGCRHSPRFISKELAESRRPELKKELA